MTQFVILTSNSSKSPSDFSITMYYQLANDTLKTIVKIGKVTL